jgi:hypothetical protein
MPLLDHLERDDATGSNVRRPESRPRHRVAIPQRPNHALGVLVRFSRGAAGRDREPLPARQAGHDDVHDIRATLPGGHHSYSRADGARRTTAMMLPSSPDGATDSAVAIARHAPDLFERRDAGGDEPERVLAERDHPLVDGRGEDLLGRR